MDASDRIAAEFDRLLTLERERIADQPFAQQLIWCVVIARCEKDMNSFEGIFEQGLNAAEIALLIDGLRGLDDFVAEEFAGAIALLQREDYYGHRNWEALSGHAKEQIAAIGERVGDRLWDLDEKLAAILDSAA